MGKIIFTADDYGVIPSIDEGIIEAVKAGKVNSVAALPNHGPKGTRSVANVVKLLEAAEASGHGKLELGVHLTITSGSPVLGRAQVPSLCRPLHSKKPGMAWEDDFKPFTKINRLSKAGLKELRAEMEEQVEVFKRAGISIHHLSSHHNSLFFYEEFYNVLLQVARNHRVPIRSFNVKPGYYNTLFKLVKLKTLNPSSERLRKLTVSFCNTSGPIKMPDFAHLGHFGLHTSRKISTPAVERLIKRKKEKILRAINEFKETVDKKHLEILVHLRKGEKLQTQLEYNQEVFKVKYAGIDPKYFNNRILEYQSILKADFLSTSSKSWGSWQML